MKKTNKTQPSLTYTLLKKAVRLLNLNDQNPDDQQFNKYLEKRFKANSKKFATPKLLKITSSLSDFHFSGMRVYVFNENKRKNNTILFLHGGAYTHQPTRFHFEFADLIAKKTFSRVIMPIYPKAPNFTCKDCYEFLLALKKQVLDENENFVLLGDSAGGGLALGFNKFLHKFNSSYARKVVLISPWLDATLSNKNIKDYEKIDPLLSKNLLQKVAIVWAGNLSTKNYKLSPLNSSFLKDVSTQIYVGSEELFLPDCRLLKEKLEQSHCYVDYFEYKSFTHDFVIYPLKETNSAKNEIINFIKKEV